MAENVAEKLGKARAVAQGPLQSVRGSGEQEKMLRNARAEYADEAEAIATYTIIDSLATVVGDKATAKARAGHHAGRGAHAEVPRRPAAESGRA
jgi:hypothetical protein